MGWVGGILWRWLMEMHPRDQLSPLDKHGLNLGKLVGNFQSLEFALRAFLINDEIAQKGPLSKSATDMHEMNEGDIVPENAFTNYDTLAKLIEKYNGNPKILSAGLTIDETLVDIRDAIAHGRVSAATPSSSLKLLKFNKPKNNQVKVTFSVLMTREWFAEQLRRVYDAVLKVSEANGKLQSGKL
jgi:hypothetical protein